MNTQTTEQAPTPSVEERAAAWITGSEEPEQEASQPQTEQSNNEQEATTEVEGPSTADDVFEFEYEGTTYALPKPLERAVQNMRDYTQKTQSVAQQRKQAEHILEQQRVANMQREFESSVAQEMSQLHEIDAILAQAKNLDWSSLNTEQILRIRTEIDQRKDQRDQLAQALQAKYQQFGQQREKAIGDLKAKAKEFAASHIPSWSEETYKAVRDHALSDGYTETELNSAELDPRHLQTLWKAQQFDLLKSKAAKTVSQVKQVRATSANPMPQQVKDKLNFRKALNKTAPNSSERRRLVEDRAAQIFK